MTIDHILTASILGAITATTVSLYLLADTAMEEKHNTIMALMDNQTITLENVEQSRERVQQIITDLKALDTAFQSGDHHKARELHNAFIQDLQYQICEPSQFDD
jgi:hypothetical protein